MENEIRSNKLVGVHNRCHRHNAHDEAESNIGRSRKKNLVAARAMGVISVVRDTVYANIPNVADGHKAMRELFDGLDYVNSVQRELDFERFDKTAVEQYLNAECDAIALGNRTPVTAYALTVDVFGQPVKVHPDAVIVSGNRLEVFKYKTGKTVIPQYSSVMDKSISTNLEIYALWLYAVEYLKQFGGTMTELAGVKYPTGGYYYFGEVKTDKCGIEEPFEGLSPLNKTNYRFLVARVEDKPYVDAIYAPTFDKWAEGVEAEECDEVDCEYCPYNAACRYHNPPIEEKAEKKAVKKAAGDVNLSVEQETVVNMVEGIARIKAGAGAGKTLVIVLRIMNLLMMGYEPEKMLMITFTVNGAAEMRERIRAYAEAYGFESSVADKIIISTFNGFGMMSVTADWTALGYTQKPDVVDSIMSKALIAEAIEGFKLPGVNYGNFEDQFNSGFDTVVKTFETIKICGLTEFNYSEVIKEPSGIQYTRADKEGVRYLNDDWFRAYDIYNAKLKEHNLIEYADQQALLMKLISDNPYYLTEKYGFEHIIVDEFQDTSNEEIELLKNLVDSTTFKSLMVVGDDAQNIFESMRHTNNDIIIDFAKYIGKDVNNIVLPDNFRSSDAIITLANKINKHRARRIADSDMIPGRHFAGEPVKLLAFSDKEDECEAVADAIEAKIADGTKPEDIAYIARTGMELRELADKLSEKGIAIQFLTPDKVFQNSRVQGILGLASFMKDNNTTGAYNFLNACEGGKLLDKTDAEVAQMINELAERCNVKLEDTVVSGEEENGGNEDSGDKASEDENLIGMLMGEAEGNLSEAVDANEGLKDASRLSTFFSEAEKLGEDDEVFNQFRDKLKKQHSFADVGKYCDAMVRFGKNETYRRAAYAGKGVILTTVHSSKGLEWKYVWLTVNGLRDEDALEESRRLLFTAVTRARDELTITGSVGKMTAAEKGCKKKKATAEELAEAASKAEAARNKRFGFLLELAVDLDVMDYTLEETYGLPVVNPSFKVAEKDKAHEAEKKAVVDVRKSLNELAITVLA